MKKTAIIITISLIVLLTVMVINCNAQNAGRMSFEITLKEGVDENYITDLKTVLNADAVPVILKSRTYRITVQDDPARRNDYLLLFNNLPAIAKVNSRPVRPVPAEESPVGAGEGVSIAVMPEDGSDFVQPEEEYVPGELLVSMKQDAPAQMWERIKRVYCLEVISHLEFINVYHVRIPEGFSTKTYERIVGLSPFVEYAELNYIMRIMN
jgi:hypothetical protein